LAGGSCISGTDEPPRCHWRREIQDLCNKTCTQRRQWLSWRANESQNQTIEIARRKARRLRPREHGAAGLDAPSAGTEGRALRRNLHRHGIRYLSAPRPSMIAPARRNPCAAELFRFVPNAVICPDCAHCVGSALVYRSRHPPVRRGRRCSFQSRCPLSNVTRPSALDGRSATVDVTEWI
jgi:hypothetical protein